MLRNTFALLGGFTPSINGSRNEARSNTKLAEQFIARNWYFALKLTGRVNK